MVPENIRRGVTITPPDGEPVTGTAYPVGAEFNDCNYWFYWDDTPELKGQGTLPPGITVTKRGQLGLNIGGTGIVTGYVSITGTSNVTASGDYNGSGVNENGCILLYIPPTELTATGIQVSWSGNAILRATAALTTVTSTGLSTDNIMNGVTIGGVTGNFVGSNDLVMKILVNASSTGATGFVTSAGQNSSASQQPQNVTGITTNKGMVFLLSTAPGNEIQVATNGGASSYISGTHIFNQEVTSLVIGPTRNQNISNCNGLCLIYN